MGTGRRRGGRVKWLTMKKTVFWSMVSTAAGTEFPCRNPERGVSGVRFLSIRSTRIAAINLVTVRWTEKAIARKNVSILETLVVFRVGSVMGVARRIAPWKNAISFR